MIKAAFPVTLIFQQQKNLSKGNAFVSSILEVIILSNNSKTKQKCYSLLILSVLYQNRAISRTFLFQRFAERRFHNVCICGSECASYVVMYVY